jgi:hypothetical protein
MPWNDSDSTHHTKKAKTPKRKRQWRKVANAILERTGDDARAIRGANAAVKKTGKRKKPRKSSR